MADENRFGRVDPATLAQRFHRCSSAVRGFRKRKRIRAVAVSGKIERVDLQAVSRKFRSQIHHDPPVGRESVQQDHRAGWLVGDARIQYGGRRVAAARVYHDSLLRQLAAANPFRSENQANDSHDEEGDLPPLWSRNIHFVVFGACPRAISERMIELTVRRSPPLRKEGDEIGGRFAK